MGSAKYVGLDVHKDTISIAVMNSAGKLIMESIIETKAITILQFFQGLHGDVYVTLEEGTWAAWLYDLLKPHVTQVVVCNPRKNALLLKQGSKSDQIDARKLAELLRLGALSAVYHGEHGLRMLYEQLDALRSLHKQAKKELLSEGRKHSATKLLRQIPGIGPLRAAQLVALMQTPHRFRTKRQLWNYSGLGLETHDSAQYCMVEGQLQRSKKPQQLRGLNDNHNHDLKNIFKLRPGKLLDMIV